VGIGIAIGIVFGIAIDAATDNLAVWIGIGSHSAGHISGKTASMSAPERRL
jgi:hypothetical protein